MRRYTQPTSQRNKQSRKLLWFALGIILLLAVVLTALELTNTINLFNRKNTSSGTASEFTKGEQSPSTNSKGTSKTSTSTLKDGDTTSSPTVDQNQKLIEPTGNFVSSHRLSVNGGQASSTCNTSPTATCVITFTQGSTVKSLPAKQADAGGGIYWTWTVQSVGLTTGQWTIKAGATLGSQRLENVDALTLEVN